MKIPAINYNTPVAPLPKQDLGPIVAQANARQRLIGQVATMGAEIYSRVQVQEGLDAYAESVAELNALEVDMGNRPASDPRDLETEFKARAGQISRKAEKNLSGQSLRVFRERYGPKREAKWFGLSNTNAHRRLKDKQASVEFKADEFFQAGDFEAGNEILSSSSVLSEPQKAELIEKGQATTVFGVARRAEASGDPVEIEKALELTTQAIDQDKVSLREGHTLTAGLKSALKLATAEDTAAQEQARAIRLGDLEVGIDKGKVGLVELRQEFAIGTIKKTAKYVELQRRIEKDRENKTSLAANRKRLSLALTRGDQIDPRDRGYIKVINVSDQATFDWIQEQALSPQEMKKAVRKLDQQAIKTAIKTGILPNRVSGMLRGYALRGAPDQVVYMANMYRTLQKQAPDTVDNLGAETIAVYEASSAMERAGVPAEKAVETARINVKASPEKLAILKNQFKDYKKSLFPGEKVYEDLLEQDQFDLSSIRDIKMTPEQLGVYQATAFQFFLLFDGDVELTTEATNNAFKRMYSGTKLGDPDGEITVMAHAPERYYKGLSADFLRKDMALFAKKYNVPNPKKMFVRSDGITIREKDNPTYLVFTINDLGQEQKVELSPGIPLRWAPKLLDAKMREKAIADRKRHLAPKSNRTQRRADQRKQSAGAFSPKF